MAGDFTDVDWGVIGCDTILPVFDCQMKLDGEYRYSDYTAEIEYPELAPVTDAEAVRWNLERYRGRIGEWPEVSAEVGSSRGEGMLDICFVPIVERGGIFLKINSFKLVVTKHPRMMASSRSASAAVERYAGNSVLHSGRWYKIRVSESGVFRLTRQFLSKIGFNDPSKVRLYGYGGAVLPETGLENLTDDLPEVPLWRSGDNILFYAQGPLSWYRVDDGSYQHRWNTYSKYGYYFLTADNDVTPAVMEEMPVQTGQAVTVDSYPDYLLYEKDAFSWMESGRMFFDSYDYATGPTKSYRFNMDGAVGDAALVSVSFSTDGSSGSVLEASFNGTELGTMTIPPRGGNDVASVKSAKFSYNGPLGGDCTVGLHLKQNSDMSARLDYIRVNYFRSLALRGPFSNFRTHPVRTPVIFRIATDRNPVVWNISNHNIRLVPSSVSDGFCVTSPTDGSDGNEYVILDPDASFPEPEAVGGIENQNLHSLDSIDMVIIIPADGSLQTQAERLAEAHRQADGIAVAVIRADRIYNEFSSGTPDATAYRRFMKMLYDKAEPGTGPRYLLLFGGGLWDNRMVTSSWPGMSPDNCLLCYESENSVSTTSSYVSDDYFGLLEDGKGQKLTTEKIDIGIGRIPVLNVSDAEAVVNKTISYIRGENAGEWQNTVVILGDDGDDNLHMSQADELASGIGGSYPSLRLRKLYWDSYPMEASSSGNSYPAVRKDILEQLEEGALLVNYTGHGAHNVFSHENVLLLNDFSTMSSRHLPLWVTASCDIAPFDASSECIGVNALLNPKGGALALLTTTRTVYSSLNMKINVLFDNYVLRQENTLGDAARLAKVQLVTPSSSIQDFSENKLHYVLLGDPALHLDVPQSRIVIDSIATDALQDGMPIAQAGGRMTLTGYVAGADGRPDEGFSGTIHPYIYDSMSHIVTRNNAEAANEPFEYDDYDKLLFHGSDSVRSGRFSIELPVTRDIRYSDAAGRAVLYAVSKEGIAVNGHSEDFLVGGTSLFMPADSAGPDIRMYLNSPDFIDGNSVNSAPCFMAELYDADGINAFGSGIGHDLLLVIDNDPRFTYVLTRYYSPVDIDYRRGRIVFPLPDLPEGKHTLMFRAWDVLGNSSTETVRFEVREGIRPDVMSVTLTENPARERTSFVISHDRPGSVESFELTVADSGGRVMWQGTYQDTSKSNISVIDWNLVTSSGQKLQRGLYIFKVTMHTKDGAYRSASGKLIIVNSSFACET